LTGFGDAKYVLGPDGGGSAHRSGKRSRWSRAPDDVAAEYFERYRAEIFSFCFSWSRSYEEAEDATQSTFLNAFNAIRRGVEPLNESAGLYAIARNVCLTRRRSVQRRRRVETPSNLELIGDVVPEHRGESSELFGLRAALESLPEQRRQVLLLREWRGLSYREIASTLGVSEASVETLLYRARKSLVKALDDVGTTTKTRHRLRLPLNLAGLLDALRNL
jgi:RNA polymerase sigma-70 factor (ECF subfamily)